MKIELTGRQSQQVAIAHLRKEMMMLQTWLEARDEDITKLQFEHFDKQKDVQSMAEMLEHAEIVLGWLGD